MPVKLIPQHNLFRVVLSRATFPKPRYPNKLPTRLGGPNRNALIRAKPVIVGIISIGTRFR